MQKLKERTFKMNTPTDASQVRGNCGSSLNREETLSVASSKTSFNNPEVNQPQRIEGLKVNVYVLSKDGFALMPCKSAKARKLLKNKQAKVVKLYPFTIKLNFECENQTQNVTLGIDSGYKNIGFSALTDKKELASGTVILDDKTSSRLTEKAMYRRGRRNKLWYRKPRFLNRKKEKGWLPLSTQRRYDTHLKLIDMYQSILPITKIRIETANFDVQKINNPEMSGVDYQHGDMYDYQNMRSYLMSREKGLCQICHKEFSKGNTSHIHHIIERANGGTDKPNNLALLHKKCHKDLHKKGIKLSPNKQFKAETFMSIIQNRFIIDIPNVEITFGYKTFVNRNAIDLEKTHYNDAFVIAGGNNQERIQSIEIKQKHRNGRTLQLNRKGFAPSIRKKRYSVQPNDLVWIDDKKEITAGTHCGGTRIIIGIKKKSVSVKKVERSYHFGSFVFINKIMENIEKHIPPTNKFVGLLC